MSLAVGGAIVRRTALYTLLALTLCAVAAAGRAGAAVPPGTVRAPITGAPILGTAGAGQLSGAAAAPSAVPSASGQIQVLKAALAKMTADYAQFADYTPGPQDIFDYGIGNEWSQGIDGSGTTIALLEGWDDPNIASTVASFDSQFGLPNPDISTIYPAGPLPKTCPARMRVLGGYGSCSAWQGELTLDVIAAHLIAPYAKIVLAVTPADTVVPSDAAENVAPPEMMESVEDIAANHLANVISVSDGTGETTYSEGTPEITAQNIGELTAAAAGIPLLGATGDCGVVQNLAQANAQCEDAGSTPSTATWDDSPWVTAVGGSVPDVSTTDGSKLGPDPLWHDPAPDAQFSEGAGFSSVFARPAYQDGVASITGSAMRSVPDLTMDAQDGTSEAAPMLAGVLALVTQANGGADVGPINPALYGTLGPAGAADGIADVVTGNDSADGPNGAVRVPGFVAGAGFDVASGWGTIDAPSFVPSLVAATQASDQEATARQDAQTQVSSLQDSSASVSPTTIPPKTTAYLSGTGFLPGYPVTVSIDGVTLTKLKANSLGDVAKTFVPTRLGLAPGTHTVTLDSLLVDETTQFTSR